jgi:phosphoenolpyruvate carboxykinase (ATP)
VGDDQALPVRLEHSRAIMAAIAAGTVDWEPDPDFGWLVAAAVAGVEPELLQPRRLYERRRRRADHRQHLERFAAATAGFLGGFPALDPALAGALERPRRP